MSLLKSAILIPARYGSTRFPGKPLEQLGGIPMIRRVADAARESGLPVYVLTDDQRVANCVNDAYTVLIDPVDYDNGTERCAGALTQDYLDKYDTFINVQGDMPDITEEAIHKAEALITSYPVSTVFTTMTEEKQNDPNSVKMVHASEHALWFGRGITGYGSWHLGVYGYSRIALEQYLNLPVPEEERIEQLEQLRWLKNGWQIGISPVYYKGVEINTPKDINEWHKNFQ